MFQNFLSLPLAGGGSVAVAVALVTGDTQHVELATSPPKKIKILFDPPPNFAFITPLKQKITKKKKLSKEIYFGQSSRKICDPKTIFFHPLLPPHNF